MRTLLTGGSGQLATALAPVLGVATIGRPGFDFDRPDAIVPLLDRERPDLVVNAAAWTAVDAAEADPDAAERANHFGPGLLAGWCARNGALLVHVSTDYVFDGNKGAPYTEGDRANPTGAYGRSKRMGELAVLASGARAVILRTSWVHAATGRNFVRTMLAAGAKTPVLRVVADQVGCPTYAPDLALAIGEVAARAGDWQDRFRGVFHAAGQGATSWHGLATEVFEQAAARGGPRPEVVPIATADWPTPARRPPDSRLDCTKLHDVFGIRMPDWQDGVRRCVAEILAEA